MVERRWAESSGKTSLATHVAFSIASITSCALGRFVFAGDIGKSDDDQDDYGHDDNDEHDDVVDHNNPSSSSSAPAVPATLGISGARLSWPRTPGTPRTPGSIFRCGTLDPRRTGRDRAPPRAWPRAGTDVCCPGRRRGPVRQPPPRGRCRSPRRGSGGGLGHARRRKAWPVRAGHFFGLRRGSSPAIGVFGVPAGNAEGLFVRLNPSLAWDDRQLMTTGGAMYHKRGHG